MRYLWTCADLTESYLTFKARQQSSAWAIFVQSPHGTDDLKPCTFWDSVDHTEDLATVTIPTQHLELESVFRFQLTVADDGRRSDSRVAYFRIVSNRATSISIQNLPRIRVDPKKLL
jgi:hypothetical protein